MRLSRSIKTNTKGVSGTDTGQLLSIAAIALASFSLGMRVGRLLTLGEKEPKDGDDKRKQSRY